mgnify:CR=1 FL=1
MILETFFEKFDQLADAPNAVAKMRELVLQLAVTGKLVEPDSKDSPASALLASAATQRASLLAERKIKARPSTPVKADEQPFELPPGWEWARLSDVGYELGQKIPDKRFTYIDVGGIDSDKGHISERVEKLEPGDAPSRARKLVARDTVIYSTVRPYLLNIAIVDQDFDPEPIASTAFGILHPFAGINNRYLFYWLRSAPFTAYVQAGMKGMAYPAINDEKFYSGFVALPPLAEQKRIVAKVDELMALCDRLETQLQERDRRHAALAHASLARFADAPTPANLNFLFHPSYTISPANLRKSILTLAVQGKLVPQDPNDEPAETRLLPPVTRPKDEQETPFELPDSWRWIQLGQVSELINGDRSKNYPNKAEYVQEGVAWINTGHIEPDGTLSTDSMYYITREKFDSLRSGKVRPGDLVYCLRGATLGKTAIITQFEEGAVASSLVIIRLCAAVDPRFAYRFLTSPLGREQIFQFDNGSAQPNLSANNVKKYWLPLPPLAEQRRIVAKVDQLMALVDELETQLAHSRDTAVKLMEAVVAELTT